MRAQAREADHEDVARAAARMEHGAPAPFAMRIDQIIDVGRDTRLRQRAHHKVPLPGAIALPVPMLHGAAAATAEMRADRGDPLCARALDPQQAAPVGMTLNCLHLDGLAGQRIRHEHRPGRRLGDAVAAMAEVGDGQVLGHAMPIRMSS